MNRLIERIKTLLVKNTFTRGVSLLVSGTIGAQALMILAAPVLTRLYTPEDFGLLAVYTSLLAISVVVASLRYELAIPLPKTDIEAANIVVLSLLVVLLMTGFSAAMVFSVNDNIEKALNAPGLAQYLWLLPVGVFFAGVYKVFNYWAVRAKNFSLIAKTTVSQALVTLSIQIASYGLGGLGLLLGQAGGRGAGSLKLGSIAFANKDFRKWDWSGVWFAAKRYRQFPMYSTGASLLNVIGNQLPPLLLALFFSSTVAGWYLLTQRILAMPVKLISGAVGKVFLSNASESMRAGQLNLLVLEIHTKLVYMIVPALFIFSLVSPTLFRLVFGEDWAVSGEIARWLSPWLALVFILSPFMVLFEVLERQLIGVVFQVSMMILRLGAILFGYFFDSYLLSIQMFMVVSVVSLFVFNVWMALATRSNIFKMARTYLYSIFLGLLIVTPAIVTSSIFSGAIAQSIGVGLSASLFLFYAYNAIKFLK